VLHLHRAERADALVAALGELLRAPAGDPLAPELVAVPTRGVERWIAQSLSARLGTSPGRADGVCANVAFPTPRRLADEAVAAASGVDPADDPWRPERLAWTLLDVVAGCAGEGWCRPLIAHLGVLPGAEEPLKRARRFTTLRHVAALLDRYAVLRPAMLTAWAAGEDVDGAGRPLRADAAWQAELWRRLRAAVGTPGPAERLAPACARLVEDPAVAALPPRLALFGLTRLPAARLAVLRALAAHRDVHLFLLHPSPALWQRLGPQLAPGPASPRRADDPTAAAPRNRLLASWGTDARELQLVLGAGADADVHHAVAGALPPRTLLERLQAAVHADAAAPGEPLPGAADERGVLEAGDASVQVHACHGRARQVEVLRDAVLGLLARDRSLEPRDVIVMCPDIELFAPLIQATFGAGNVGSAGAGDDERAELVPAADRPPDLRVRLADRALRQTNPVLGVVATLLDLADGRATASQVLDLADRPPVRRRLRLDDDDLQRLEDWVAQSGIRWGLDAPHRAPFGLGSVWNGTWQAGLSRVLLGAAMTEDGHRLVGRVLPLDDVGSGSIELAGRFAELVERLTAALTALGRTQPIGAWADAIAEAADLLTLAAPREAWQRAGLGRILAEVAGDAGESGAELALPEVRALLADRLAGRPTRANFRTGHLTVCTLVPMRSVPHRVVCLLGLDDGVFPRTPPRDGDDLVLADPHVGDRDARTEDRQLLLDALLAARETLVITYTGNDERTNEPRPPAVPVGELLDVVDRTVRVDDPVRGRPRDRVVVRHPLQPFDPRNFDAAAPRSFDRAALGGARALAAGERPAAPPFLPGPLAPVVADVVAVDDLVRFVRHPARAFLRDRLDVRLGDPEDELADALPVELDGLQKYAIGQRMLEARLAGGERAAVLRAEGVRGELPPLALGEHVIRELDAGVEALVERAHALVDPAAAPAALDVRVVLAGGRLVTGTVNGLRGDVLLSVAFARLSAKHRLAAWVRLLALAAAHPERSFTAVTVGRAQDKRARAPVVAKRLAGVSADVAVRHLARLVDLRDRGLREPLPIAAKASAAYAEAGGDPVVAAAKAWESDFRMPKEDREPEHVRVLGGVVPFTDLHVAAPRDDERGDGWDATEHTRFGRLAVRLWGGVLQHEEDA